MRDDTSPYGRRLAWICLLGAAAFVGWNLAGAIHEYSHAGAAVALGGTVNRIQAWHLLGAAVTYVSDLSPTKKAIVDVAGLAVTNAIEVGVLLTVRWRKLRGEVATALAMVLVFFVVQAGQPALGGPCRG